MGHIALPSVKSDAYNIIRKTLVLVYTCAHIKHVRIYCKADSQDAVPQDARIIAYKHIQEDFAEYPYTYLLPGVHVYAVGIGDFDTNELNGIASAPSSQNAYILSDYSGLSNISSSIVKKTCRGKQKTFCRV